jgi:murein DD-endopeptidase MepM/ murein hydrolase activator NlpD
MEMRKFLIVAVVVSCAFLVLQNSDFGVRQKEVKAGNNSTDALSASRACREISGRIEKGETLFDIFKKYHLDLRDLFKLREASADIYKLKNVCSCRPYKIVVDEKDRIESFAYSIDDDTILNIKCTDSGYCAEKIPASYEKRMRYIGGIIRDNLISSMNDTDGDLMLALQLSDIFAWDIDFTTDLRKGDVFKIVVEGLYQNGQFKKFGDVLSAEFINNGKVYRAYRFEANGKADYYNEDGQSLKRAFLKAPLNFRRISSFFSGRRFNPLLKIWRPHHGLDYAAPTGTPVSASGDGTVVFVGKRGGYGNLIELRHGNGYTTYYGHLSRIRKGIRKGEKVTQGEVIAYVGSTGLSTGPHLHYEMRINNRPLNPLSVKIPHGESIPKKELAAFRRMRFMMDTRLASIPSANFAATEVKPAGGTGRG